MTVRYPVEEPRATDPGLPQLKRNEQGKARCVACYLCSTACPADCIEIEAVPVADGDRRFPQRFEIDALRCIFCGCCVEACPVAAIDMGPKRPLAAGNRRELFFDREKLLAD
jgi:NADH-quinone oxidoreductase subunit I